MKTAYSETELQKLLQDVETEIGSLVKSEKQKLAKAHPGEETSDEVPADASATAPADAAPPAASATPPAPVSASPADAAPPADATAPDAASAPPVDGSAPDAAGDPAADQSADPAALQAEYAKLPPEDLKAHYLACKSALFAIMGAAAGPDAGAPAPDAAPPVASAPPAASPSAPPAMKAEMPAGPGIPAPTPTGPVSPERPAPVGKAELNGLSAGSPKVAPAPLPAGPGIQKSEKDSKIEELTASLSKSEQGVQDLLAIASMLVEAPRRKAITSIAHVARTEENSASDVSNLTKAEVKTRLKRAIETKLSKSDRELVYGYDNGSVGVEQIAHLLKS